MAEEDALCSKKVAETAEEKRNLMRSRLHNYRGAIKAGAIALQQQLPDLMAKYGLSAPDMASGSSGETVGLEDFFRWLRTCVAMVEASARFYEDLSAIVAVRTLSATVYGLFPSASGYAGSVTKGQFCSLRDPGFAWPGDDAVRP